LSSLTPVFIALGSNLGDRHAHLGWAVGKLGERLRGLRVSTFRESAPMDVPDVQPAYLNGVATGGTTMLAHEVLDWLLALETERGRVRDHERAARTLDLDLILYGGEVIDSPGLVVPHPRFRTRPFVLEPLAELAPAFVDPVTGRTVGQLLEDLRTAGPKAAPRT
jgi:2-amino-4-hydroxy-6-hydroxymethyldihydropteridine diphosphokinase